MDQSLEAFLSDLPRRMQHLVRPGLPKYMVLRDVVSYAIVTGALEPGTRLPTESEWTKQVPLSLGTIQRALRMLADDGLVVRKQGHGTFVAEQEPRSMHAPMHCRFLSNNGGEYMPVYPQVVARYVTDAKGRWSSHLASSSALCIERLLDIGHEFCVYSRFYCDPERIPSFASLADSHLSGENFKEIIMRETGQMIGRIDLFTQSHAFDKEECERLGLPIGEKGQKQLIYAYLGRDNPVYYQELLIPLHDRIHHLSTHGREEPLPPLTP